MDFRDCPRQSGLHILTRKWSLYILRALKAPKSFSEIQQEYTVITNHILSQELHKLLEEKVVTHAEDKYVLTESGEALLDAAEALHQWSARYHKLTPCPEELSCSDCEQYKRMIEKTE